MGYPQGRWPLGPAWGEHKEEVRSPEAIPALPAISVQSWGQSLHGKRDPGVSQDHWSWSGRARKEVQGGGLEEEGETQVDIGREDNSPTSGTRPIKNPNLGISSSCEHLI